VRDKREGMVVAGIDVGAATAKTVILGDGEICRGESLDFFADVTIKYSGR
jgi:activator of 2-hydroxyglutaryl-CoA dehydratase